MQSESSFISHSHEETQQLAKRLANALQPPMVITLTGDLGAGKTTFVQSFIAALSGGEKLRVKSPTFALHHAFDTKPKAHHLDLYRLSDESELDAIGFSELLYEQNAFILIEWPQIAERELPAHTLRMRFIELAGEKREIQFRWPKSQKPVDF